MPDSRTLRSEARERYKPDRLKCLLIAEAPPSDESRYFYFDHVPSRDGLFVETMKVLFPSVAADYLGNRGRELKRSLLSSFQREGYWLVDAFEEPLRRRTWRMEDSNLTERLEKLREEAFLTRTTPVILIKIAVYQEFYDVLTHHGYCVIDERMPFPASGRQKEFRQSFERALRLVRRERR